MILYLDTSSLVKLYLEEAGSSEVRDLASRSEVLATSTVAYPEARSAFARLSREDRLDTRGLATVFAAFEEDWASFLSLPAEIQICRRAGHLAEAHALRGFDAIHLASFLELVDKTAGEAVEFSSFDTRLSAAAIRATNETGF